MIKFFSTSEKTRLTNHILNENSNLFKYNFIIEDKDHLILENMKKNSELDEQQITLIENKTAKYGKENIKVFKLNIARDFYERLLIYEAHAARNTFSDDFLSILELPFLSYFDHYEILKECLLKYILEDEENRVIEIMKYFLAKNIKLKKNENEKDILVNLQKAIEQKDLIVIYEFIFSQNSCLSELNQNKEIQKFYSHEIIKHLADLFTFFTEKVDLILYDSEYNNIICIYDHDNQEDGIEIFVSQMPKMIQFTRKKNAILYLIGYHMKRIEECIDFLVTFEKIYIDVTYICNFLTNKRINELRNSNDDLQKLLKLFFIEKQYENVFVKMFKSAFKAKWMNQKNRVDFSSEAIFLDLHKFDSRMAILEKIKLFGMKHIMLGSNTILYAFLSNYLNQPSFEYEITNFAKNDLSYHTSKNNSYYNSKNNKYVFSYGYLKTDHHKLHNECFQPWEKTHCNLEFYDESCEKPFFFTGFFSIDTMKIICENYLTSFITKNAIFLKNSNKNISEFAEISNLEKYEAFTKDDTFETNFPQFKELEIKSKYLACNFMNLIYVRHKKFISSTGVLNYNNNVFSAYGCRITFLKTFDDSLDSISLSNCNICSFSENQVQIQSDLYSHLKLSFVDVKFDCDLILSGYFRDVEFKYIKGYKSVVRLQLNFYPFKIENSNSKCEIENMFSMKTNNMEEEYNEISYERNSLHIYCYDVTFLSNVQNHVDYLSFSCAKLYAQNDSESIIIELQDKQSKKEIKNSVVLNSCQTEQFVEFKGKYSSILINNVKGEKFDCKIEEDLDNLNVSTEDKTEIYKNEVLIHLQTPNFVFKNTNPLFSLKIVKAKRSIYIKNAFLKLSEDIFTSFNNIVLDNVEFENKDIMIKMMPNISYLNIENTECKIEHPDLKIIQCTKESVVFYEHGKKPQFEKIRFLAEQSVLRILLKYDIKDCTHIVKGQEAKLKTPSELKSNLKKYFRRGDNYQQLAHQE